MQRKPESVKERFLLKLLSLFVVLFVYHHTILNNDLYVVFFRLRIVACLSWYGFVDVFGYGEKQFLLGTEYITSFILITHFPTLLFVIVELGHKSLWILVLF